MIWLSAVDKKRSCVVNLTRFNVEHFNDVVQYGYGFRLDLLHIYAVLDDKTGVMSVKD
jgi:hypothetical protein